MVGCGALQDEAHEAAAIAIVTATIHINTNILGVLVSSLLKIVDAELGVPGRLLGKQKSRYSCHASGICVTPIVL